MPNDNYFYATQDLSTNSGQQGQKGINSNDTGILNSPLIKNECNWKMLNFHMGFTSH